MRSNLLKNTQDLWGALPFATPLSTADKANGGGIILFEEGNKIRSGWKKTFISFFLET